MKEKKIEKNARRDALKKARQICNKKEELETPEAQLFLKFLSTYPMADTTIGTCEMLWQFIHWCGENGIHLINEKTIFCFPFSRMLRFKDLK